MPLEAIVPRVADRKAKGEEEQGCFRSMAEPNKVAGDVSYP